MSKILEALRSSGWQVDHTCKTINGKHTIDSQEPKRKKYEHNIKGNNQTTKEKTERNKEIQSQLEKLRFKMVMYTYLSMITLNVNELNAPSKRHRMAGWIKKKKSLPTRDPLQGKGHTQTESEEMETDISSKCKWQGNGGSNSHMGQNRF